MLSCEAGREQPIAAFSMCNSIDCKEGINKFVNRDQINTFSVQYYLLHTTTISVNWLKQMENIINKKQVQSNANQAHHHHYSQIDNSRLSAKVRIISM